MQYSAFSIARQEAPSGSDEGLSERPGLQPLSIFQ